MSSGDETSGARGASPDGGGAGASGHGKDGPDRAGATAAGVRKRRQHHVWQHYLKPWTTDGQVHCLSGGRIYRANTVNVAVERDFYRLAPLSELDVAIIRKLVIDQSHPYGRHVHEEFLSALLAPRRFVEANRDRIGNLPEVDGLLDVHANNVLEDYHGAIEDSFSGLLERAVRGDVGFYEDKDDCSTFIHYLCSQHTRTAGIRERVVSGARDNMGLDTSRVWPVISHMVAGNVGASLYAERASRELLVLRNGTDVPFVTSDQPVLNLLGASSGRPLTGVAFYYPVTPALALVLSETGGRSPVTAGGLDPPQVAHLNARMLKASYRQVFGVSGTHLAEVLAAAGMGPGPG